MNVASGVMTVIKVSIRDGWILGYVHHDGHVSFMMRGEMIHFDSIPDAVKAWPHVEGADPQ